MTVGKEPSPLRASPAPQSTSTPAPHGALSPISHRRRRGNEKEGVLCEQWGEETHLVVGPPDVEQALEQLALAIVVLRFNRSEALRGGRSCDGCRVADLASSGVVVVAVVRVGVADDRRRGRNGRPGGRGHAVASEAEGEAREREVGDVCELNDDALFCKMRRGICCADG